jgi:hypothetical protein
MWLCVWVSESVCECESVCEWVKSVYEWVKSVCVWVIKSVRVCGRLGYTRLVNE